MENPKKNEEAIKIYKARFQLEVEIRKVERRPKHVYPRIFNLSFDMPVKGLLFGETKYNAKQRRKQYRRIKMKWKRNKSDNKIRNLLYDIQVKELELQSKIYSKFGWIDERFLDQELKRRETFLKSMNNLSPFHTTLRSTPVTSIETTSLNTIRTLRKKLNAYKKKKETIYKGLGDKLVPGAGRISPKGTALLIDYENLGENYKVYENGKLVAILSRDVEGKGNITYGYGILFKNTEDEIKRLKDTYGLEFAEKVRAPISLCEAMYQDYVNTNLPSLNAFTLENKIWLNQNQLDALLMHRHLTYRLGSKTQATLIGMFKNTDANDPNLKKLYWDNLFNAMLGDLKDTVNDADYKIYKDGWTS